jgi:hypothetical protein
MAKLRKVYTVQEIDKNNFKLCKVLNEYENSKNAYDDLIDLIKHLTTEEKLLKEFTKKEENI